MLVQYVLSRGRLLKKQKVAHQQQTLLALSNCKMTILYIKCLEFTLSKCYFKTLFKNKLLNHHNNQ